MKSDVLTRFFFFESVKLLALSPSQSLFCLTNSPAGPLAHSIHSIPQQKMPTLTAQAGHVSVFQVSAPQTTRSVLAHLRLRHQGGKAWSNATSCMHRCCNFAKRPHQRTSSPFTSLLLPYYICSPGVCESALCILPSAPDSPCELELETQARVTKMRRMTWRN